MGADGDGGVGEVLFYLDEGDDLVDADLLFGNFEGDVAGYADVSEAGGPVPAELVGGFAEPVGFVEGFGEGVVVLVAEAFGLFVCGADDAGFDDDGDPVFAGAEVFGDVEAAGGEGVVVGADLFSVEVDLGVEVEGFEVEPGVGVF